MLPPFGETTVDQERLGQIGMAANDAAAAMDGAFQLVDVLGLELANSWA